MREMLKVVGNPFPLKGSVRQRVRQTPGTCPWHRDSVTAFFSL